jgi:hypothetical protein
MQITIEYMILIPVLILQLFLFPLTAGWIMNNWVDQRRNLELQEIASHLGSSIQQIYFSLNHTSIQAGKLSYTLVDLPPFVEGYAYTGNATLRTVQSNNVLDITLKFTGQDISTATSVTLGQNVQWITSSFDSMNAAITAEKLSDASNTIRISFGI